MNRSTARKGRDMSRKKDGLVRGRPLLCLGDISLPLSISLSHPLSFPKGFEAAYKIIRLHPYLSSTMLDT